MLASRVGVFAFFFMAMADAVAGLSSAQSFDFYDTSGNKIGTGGAYTKRFASPPVAPADVSGVRIAGLVQGKASVSPTGAARYSIPISLPRSLAGFGPALSLEYSSSSPRGLLGVGWSVGGLSQITRCPQTAPQDFLAMGVKLAPSDRFCLDGQRLVSATGDYRNPDGTGYTVGSYGGEPGSGAYAPSYQTEVTNFSRVVQSGWQGNGPQSFTVTTRDGIVMEFGGTESSRALGNSTSSTGVITDQSTVLVWALNKVTDRRNNTWTVTYARDPGAGSLYPAQIDYTANVAAGVSSANRVVFDFDALQQEETTLQYLGASRIVSGKRLRKISIYVGQKPAKEYRFSYDALDESGLPFHASRLNKITECQYRQIELSCLDPVYLDWSSNASFKVETTSSSFSAYVQAEDDIGKFSLVGDVNADGRSDIVRPDSGLQAVLADSTETAVSLKPNIVVSGSIVDGSVSSYLFDINEDGIADNVYPKVVSGSIVVYVQYGALSGVFGNPVQIGSTPFSGSLSNSRIFYEDVNNDGRKDVVVITPNLVNFRATANIYSFLKSDTGWSSLYAAYIDFPDDTSASVDALPQIFSIMDIDGDSVMDAVFLGPWSSRDYSNKLYVAYGYRAFSASGGNGTFNGGSSPVANTPPFTSIDVPRSTMQWLNSMCGTGVCKALDNASTSVNTAYRRSDSIENRFFRDVNRDGLVDIVTEGAVGVLKCMGAMLSCGAKQLSSQGLLLHLSVDGRGLESGRHEVSAGKRASGFYQLYWRYKYPVWRSCS